LHRWDAKFALVDERFIAIYPPTRASAISITVILLTVGIGFTHIDDNFGNFRLNLFKPFYLHVDALLGTGQMALHLHSGTVEAVVGSLSSAIDVLEDVDFGFLDFRAPNLQSLGYTLVVVALANFLY
jgi:hypothetical protein